MMSAPLSRFRSALIVGKFAPMHKGHQFLIETALEHADHVTVLVYSVPDFPAMPAPRRAQWVRTLYSTCRVLVPEGAPPDAAPDQDHRSFLKTWLARNRIAPDAVLTSEAYGPPLAEALGIAHVMVDSARANVPVSATRLRQDPALLQEFVDPIVVADLSDPYWFRRG
jgi:cytidyltransferase-like protein